MNMKNKIIIAVVAVVAFVCAGVVAQEQEQAQKTVAVVVPFESGASGVPQEEVDVVYQMFLSEFVRTGKCAVVDRSTFDKAKTQLAFKAADLTDNNKVAKLGKTLNASVVVTGQIMKFRTKFMFIMQVLDVDKTEIIASADEQVDDIAELFGEFNKICKALTKNFAKPQDALTRSYYIGDTGPGGGIVFYYSALGFLVQESDDANPVICHYLECSPTEVGTISWCPCEKNHWCDVETADGVGTGSLNTAHIIASAHYHSITPSNCAAYACSRYSTETTDAGEWYLPSKFELDLLYKNLRRSGKITSDAWHWSSLQGSNYEAFDQRFSDGGIHGYGDPNKYNRGVVRAVHAF